MYFFSFLRQITKNVGLFLEKSVGGNDPSWCFLSTHSVCNDARKRFWVLINFQLTLREAAHTFESFLWRAESVYIFSWGACCSAASRKTLCSIQPTRDFTTPAPV